MASEKVQVIYELVDKASAGIRSMTSTILGAINPLNNIRSIGSAAFDYLSRAITASIKAAEESRQVMAQTEAVIKSTGGAAGVTAESVSKLANQISLLSSYDDEAVQSAENLLLTFKNVKKDAFEPATQAIVDMSAAMGQDLQTSTIQVGKALNDPIAGLTSLARVGVTFNDTQKDMIKSMVESGNTMGAQKVILKELQSQFGGSAAAVADPFKQAQNALENLAESFGTALLPIASAAASTFTQLATVLAKIDFSGIGKGLQKTFVEIKTMMRISVEELKALIASPFDWRTYSAIAVSMVENIAKLAKAITDTMKRGWSAFQDYRKQVQEDEAKDGLTLEQRIAKIKAEGAAEKKKIDADYQKSRVARNENANVEMVQNDAGASKKSTADRKKQLDVVLAHHKDVVDNMKAKNDWSAAAETKMLFDLLAKHQFTAEQKLAIDTQIAALQTKMRDEQSSAITTSFNNQLAEKKALGELTIQGELDMYAQMLANKELSESDRKKIEDDYRTARLKSDTEAVQQKEEMERRFGGWFLDSVNDVANQQISIQDKLLKTMGGFIRRALESQLDAILAAESGKAIMAAWAAAIPTWGGSIAALAPQLATMAAASLAAKSALNVLNFEDGGIVQARSGGTIGRIGEGGSDEAVIPINSRAGRQLLGGGERVVQIVLNDGTMLAKGIWRETERLKRTGQIGRTTQ